MLNIPVWSLGYWPIILNYSVFNYKAIEGGRLSHDVAEFLPTSFWAGYGQVTIRSTNYTTTDFKHAILIGCKSHIWHVDTVLLGIDKSLCANLVQNYQNYQNYSLKSHKIISQITKCLNILNRKPLHSKVHLAFFHWKVSAKAPAVHVECTGDSAWTSDSEKPGS